VSRWGAKRPQVFSFAAKNAGAAARPIATQGRSYKGQCWLEEISDRLTLVSRFITSCFLRSGIMRRASGAIRTLRIIVPFFFTLGSAARCLRLFAHLPS